MAVATEPALDGLEANRAWMDSKVDIIGCLTACIGRPVAIPTSIAPSNKNPACCLSVCPQDVALVDALVGEGQAHLFAGWPPAGERDDDKRRLLAQLTHLDASYAGGLCKYIQNARKLLRESKEGVQSVEGRQRACKASPLSTPPPHGMSAEYHPAPPPPRAHTSALPPVIWPPCRAAAAAAGVNPFEGCVPSVPEGERLDFGSDQFRELERAGVGAAADAAFVLVAGGLGERLGYSGIKVALPVESASGMCFLQLYIESILALGVRRALPTLLCCSGRTVLRTALPCW